MKITLDQIRTMIEADLESKNERLASSFRTMQNHINHAGVERLLQEAKEELE